MTGLLEDMKRAIDESGMSRYRISKESGVAASQLSRLVNGERGLSIEAMERVAEVLGFEIVLRRKRSGGTKRVESS